VTAHSAQLTDAAQLLYDAQISGIPIQPLTQMYPDLDVAQAYSVQRLNRARYIDGGAVVRGHMIGLTSAPMQEPLGVSEPGSATSSTAWCCLTVRGCR
jgi:2-keto-4-pentenoate hydratase